MKRRTISLLLGVAAVAIMAVPTVVIGGGVAVCGVLAAVLVWMSLVSPTEEVVGGALILGAVAAVLALDRGLPVSGALAAITVVSAALADASRDAGTATRDEPAEHLHWLVHAGLSIGLATVTTLVVGLAVALHPPRWVGLAAVGALSAVVLVVVTVRVLRPDKSF